MVYKFNVEIATPCGFPVISQYIIDAATPEDARREIVHQVIEASGWVKKILPIDNSTLGIT
jgi:hypothetical protein